MYLLLFENIIQQHGIHFNCCDDDNQLSSSTKPEDTDQLVEIQAHPKDALMTSNIFLSNSDITQVIVFSPKILMDKLNHIITLVVISLITQ